MCVFSGGTGASSPVCCVQQAQALSLCGVVWAELELYGLYAVGHAAPSGRGCSLLNPDTVAFITECGRSNAEELTTGYDSR